MKIAVPAETQSGESRVAATPETVKRYIALGATVAVEAGAGERSYLADEAYREAGATIATDRSSLLKDADVVLAVRRPSADDIAMMKAGAAAIALMDPWSDRAGIDAMAERGLVAFAMELMPRITRAQSMDVLSSQANLAGYKAAIDAAATFGRAFPMMMTAAGTIPPARVFVMGAGVAGLQAIATAKRLGAIVSATDVRRAAEEQAKSLGANFVMVESGEDLETAGGYAKEMSEDYQRRQAELIAETVKKQDVVITTALIPGRPAPTLLTREMVESMKPGSVIVDLAVERGGNCALSKPGETVEHNGVTIIGHLNMAGRLAGNASQLYAKNLQNFLELMIDADTGTLKVNWEDEIVQGTALTRDGKVVHPMLAEGADA